MDGSFEDDADTQYAKEISLAEHVSLTPVSQSVTPVEKPNTPEEYLKELLLQQETWPFKLTDGHEVKIPKIFLEPFGVFRTMFSSSVPKDNTLPVPVEHGAFFLKMLNAIYSNSWKVTAKELSQFVFLGDILDLDPVLFKIIIEKNKDQISDKTLGKFGEIYSGKNMNEVVGGFFNLLKSILRPKIEKGDFDGMPASCIGCALTRDFVCECLKKSEEKIEEGRSFVGFYNQFFVGRYISGRCINDTFVPGHHQEVNEQPFSLTALYDVLACFRWFYCQKEKFDTKVSTFQRLYPGFRVPDRITSAFAFRRSLVQSYTGKNKQKKPAPTPSAASAAATTLSSAANYATTAANHSCDDDVDGNTPTNDEKEYYRHDPLKIHGLPVPRGCPYKQNVVSSTGLRKDLLAFITTTVDPTLVEFIVNIYPRQVRDYLGRREEWCLKITAYNDQFSCPITLRGIKIWIPTMTTMTPDQWELVKGEKIKTSFTFARPMEIKLPHKVEAVMIEVDRVFPDPDTKVVTKPKNLTRRRF